MDLHVGGRTLRLEVTRGREPIGCSHCRRKQLVERKKWRNKRKVAALLGWLVLVDVKRPLLISKKPTTHKD